MRQIKGFVCVARVKNPRPFLKQQQLFGRAIDPVTIERGYEAFRTNDLVPFELLADAVLARNNMRRNPDFTSVRIADIEMDVAEDEGDWGKFSFRQARSWVVIIHHKFERECELVGARTGGAFGRAMPGTPIELNGLKPFRSWRNVEWTANDSARQSQCPVQIATFRLRKCALKD